MRESSVEKHLVKRCKEIGALCEKFKSIGRAHVPDRIVTFYQYNRGSVFFVETKAPGKKPRAGQVRDHKRREAQGVKVWVLDSIVEVDLFIFDLQTHGVNSPLSPKIQEFIKVSKEFNALAKETVLHGD